MTEHSYGPSWEKCERCSITDKGHDVWECIAKIKRDSSKKDLVIEELIDFLHMWIRHGAMDGPNFLECLEHGKETVGNGFRIRESRTMPGKRGASTDKVSFKILKVRQ